MLLTQNHGSRCFCLESRDVEPASIWWEGEAKLRIGAVEDSLCMGCVGVMLCALRSLVAGCVWK